jgi:hypothetical protein
LKKPSDIFMYTDEGTRYQLIGLIVLGNDL